MADEVTAVTDWDWSTIAICAATFLGPIFAVLVTRWNDDRKATRERRMQLFRILMGTRRLPLSPDHVGALNLVEIEFKDTDILKAWRDVVTHLSSNPGQPTPQDWGDRLETLKGKMLGKIAKKMGFDATDLDVFKGGYVPTAWGKNEERQELLWRYIYDLAMGRNYLPVAPFQPDLGQSHSIAPTPPAPPGSSQTQPGPLNLS